MATSFTRNGKSEGRKAPAKRRQRKTNEREEEREGPSRLLLCAPFIAKRSRNFAQASSAPNSQAEETFPLGRMTIQNYLRSTRSVLSHGM